MAHGAEKSGTTPTLASHTSDLTVRLSRIPSQYAKHTHTNIQKRKAKVKTHSIKTAVSIKRKTEVIERQQDTQDHTLNIKAAMIHGASTGLHTFYQPRLALTNI